MNIQVILSLSLSAGVRRIQRNLQSKRREEEEEEKSRSFDDDGATRDSRFQQQQQQQLGHIDKFE